MSEPYPRTEAELIELLRSSEPRAPEALHRRVESLIAERSSSPRRGLLGASPGLGGRRLVLRLGAPLALLAAAAALLAFALPGGGRPLTLRDATALTLAAAEAPAPRESPSHTSEMVTAVEGVHFPYWKEGFGWRATGQRSDRVRGRRVTTVFYANRSGQRIGYAIVAGAPAPRVSGGTLSWRGGRPYRLLVEHRAPVVTWLRDGRLCVLSGRGVDSATLLRLASWGERGSAA
jgi:hypothetical protein